MIPDNLANRIEAILLARAGWVSVEEVCALCEIPERITRADGKRRPIFSLFAISSSTKGLKHLDHTTARERITYKHSKQKVIVAYYRALRDYNNALANCLTGKFPRQEERFTHQATLFPL